MSDERDTTNTEDENKKTKKPLPFVEVRSIEDLIPDENNINKHTQRGHGVVENSIRRRGVGRGILAAGKGSEKPVIMAGNLTHEKARDAGIEDVIFVHTTGNQLVVTVRDDLDPSSPQAVALGIEDNEAGKLSYNPDIDLLAALTSGDSGLLSKLKKDDDIFGSVVDGILPFDPNSEWEGMPEFENASGAAEKSIHVHFETGEDYLEFCEKLGVPVVEGRTMWYPLKGKKKNRVEDEYGG